MEGSWKNLSLSTCSSNLSKRNCNSLEKCNQERRVTKRPCSTFLKCSERVSERLENDKLTRRLMVRNGHIASLMSTRLLLFQEKQKKSSVRFPRAASRLPPLAAAPYAALAGRSHCQSEARDDGCVPLSLRARVPMPRRVRPPRRGSGNAILIVDHNQSSLPRVTHRPSQPF